MRRISVVVAMSTLLFGADACGGKTEGGTGGGTGGAGGGTGGAGGSTGGAGGVGAGPAGGYGGYPIGGDGGYPIGGDGGYPFGGDGGYPFGGDGGYPFGGYGGYPVGGYGGGGTSGCSDCKDYLFGIPDKILGMKACCGPNSACGGWVDANISGLLGGIPQGCYEIDQPGTPDPTCPPWNYIDPVNGNPASFPGCCRTVGACGYWLDTSKYQGPSFGCVDSGPISGAPPQSCGTTMLCGPCLQAYCAGELNACLTFDPCAQLLACMQTCPDQTCAGKCYASHPTGQKYFDALALCANLKCAVECV
jgi:hypothetical protein